MEQTLDDLVKYVRDKAEAEASEIKSKADAEYEKASENSKKSYSERLSARKKELSAGSEKRIAEFVRQENAKDRKKLTEYADFLSDRLFEESAEKLSSMSGEEFKKFFTESVRSLGIKGRYTVVPGESSMGYITPDLISSFEKDGLSLSLSDTFVSEDGGFVLASGKVEYSFLFSDLLGELKKTEKPRLISKIVSREV